MVGIIDLVLDGPAGPIIVDFKTAARGGQPPPVMHELQLTAYSYLLRQATGDSEQGLEIRQLVKGRQPRLERYCHPPRTDDQLRRLFAVLRGYLSALDRREFFFRPGPGCTFCEHLDSACQHWTP